MPILHIQGSIEDILKSSLKPESFSDCKILGQEQDGLILFCWSVLKSSQQVTEIGVVNVDTQTVQVLVTLPPTKNIVQGTVNSTKTALAFVTKLVTTDSESEIETYQYDLHLLPVGDSTQIANPEAFVTSSNQVMGQFLYKKKKKGPDRFLVFNHQNAITLYQVSTDQECSHSVIEIIVKAFSWAQWDVENQSLFYIHYRKSQARVEGEEVEGESKSPTLSALQFNDDTPHETVLNIPLNLPPPVLESTCNTYEEFPIPLRVHDCSLNVTVLTDERGVICICHHYLYQPVQAPSSNLEPVDENATVHFAYSVTLLHHGAVIHSNITGIPWIQASQIRPTFSLFEDEHMIVFSPGVFLHVLDIGPGHEPCCHILLPDKSADLEDKWVVVKSDSDAARLISLTKLNRAEFKIESKFLVESYLDPKTDLSNKLAILHYFLVHENDFESVIELLLNVANECLNPAIVKVFQEALLGGAFASVLRSLPTDAIPLLKFLPMTSVNQADPIEIKFKSDVMTISQEALWNRAVVLLSPRQRLLPSRIDLWTKLWDLIASSEDTARFKPSTVFEKLMFSLGCYQPEALSRCSTPLSPGGSFNNTSALADMASLVTGRTKPLLPFYEIEKCTASKQEHVISVNLRELSMHLVKYGRENPMQVHAVATRYAAAQLEMSRLLCSIVTRSCGIPLHQASKGFQLVSELSSAKKLIFFNVLEKYVQAVESLAFPLPNGFSSFFTYLAYSILPLEKFVQYVQANVLQLQIDVIKEIMTALDKHPDGVKLKLRLILLLSRSRARRLLNQWSHPKSLMIRAREHAANILSGQESRAHLPRTKAHSNAGLSTFHSSDRMSPLDTFLDLLTAKASLAELDFNLLVEATMSSTQI